MGHWDGIPRQIVQDREGGDKEMSQQNVDSRGNYRVGTKAGDTRELQIKLLQANIGLPVRGSARVAGYDLCAANSCGLPSQGKGTIKIGLAVSLPLGMYA